MWELRYKIFGCKTNKFFTEKWFSSGYLQGASGIFIASCVVTDTATRKWLRFIRHEIKNLSKDEKIFLSGCGAFEKRGVDKGFYKKFPELLPFSEKIILLPEEPEKIPKITKDSFLQKKSLVSKISKLKSGKIYTRKHIVIQTGCDTFCTFCATIQSRGRHQSRPADEIISEILDFEQIGGKEIVITGINLGAWGASTTLDVESSWFPDLLEKILKETKISRIRVSSIGIEFLHDRLFEIFKNKRINPHFHLSVQSGSDKILKKMNRKYDRAMLLDRLKKFSEIKREDDVGISIGVDLITGFPGETEWDFKDTYDLIKKFNFTKVHAFPFSAHVLSHPVPAQKFPDQIDLKIKRERLARLLEAEAEVREKFLQKNSGKTLEILVEKVWEKGEFSGWSENYIALDENNFSPMKKIKKGEIILGVFWI